MKGATMVFGSKKKKAATKKAAKAATAKVEEVVMPVARLRELYDSKLLGPREKREVWDALEDRKNPARGVATVERIDARMAAEEVIFKGLRVWLVDDMLVNEERDAVSAVLKSRDVQRARHIVATVNKRLKK